MKMIHGRSSARVLRRGVDRLLHGRVLAAAVRGDDRVRIASRRHGAGVRLGEQMRRRARARLGATRRRQAARRGRCLSRSDGCGRPRRSRSRGLTAPTPLSPIVSACSMLRRARSISGTFFSAASALTASTYGVSVEIDCPSFEVAARQRGHEHRLRTNRARRRRRSATCSAGSVVRGSVSRSGPLPGWSLWPN